MNSISSKSYSLSNKADFQIVLDILNKPFKLRSEQEQNDLQLSLEKVFPFFEKMRSELNKKVYIQLHEQLLYEYHKKRTILFQIEEPGDKFFIILKGEVYVLVREKGLENSKRSTSPPSLSPTFKSFTNENMANSFAKISPLAKKNSDLYETIRNLKRGKTFTEDNLNDEEFLKLKFPDLYVDRILKTGDSFGEVAIRQSILRTATIVCKTNCHFGVLTKKSFQRILKYHFDSVMNQNLILLKKQSIFSEWTYPELEQFYLHMTEETFIRNQVIFKENDPSDKFYIIKEGEIEISQDIEDNDKDKNISKNLKKIKILNERIFKTYKKIKTKKIVLAIELEGEILGIEDLIEDSPRSYQAKCISPVAKLLIISKEKFLAYANDTKTLIKLIEVRGNKSQWHSKWKDKFSLFSLPQDNYIQKSDRTANKSNLKSKFVGKLHSIDNGIDINRLEDILKKLENNSKIKDLINIIDENKKKLSKQKLEYHDYLSISINRSAKNNLTKLDFSKLQKNKSINEKKNDFNFGNKNSKYFLLNLPFFNCEENEENIYSQRANPPKIKKIKDNFFFLPTIKNNDKSKFNSFQELKNSLHISKIQ